MSLTDLFENPPFTLTVIWHPDFELGQQVANQLYEHFRGDAYKGVARNAGIEVLFRSAPAPGSATPLPLVLDRDRCHAVVILVEDHLKNALPGGWGSYVDEIVQWVDATDEASLVFPIAFNKEALTAHPSLGATNFIRWYDWPGDEIRHLTSVLTHELCRLLLPWVKAVEEGKDLPPVVDETPEPVTVFISHSKQDGDTLARQIRDLIHQSSLKSFFDAYDIPPGRSFAKEIRGRIRKSVLLVVQTDSYASREWCRMEVLEARRCEVPVVVLNAVKEGESRAFPYGGNVPVVMAGGLEEARLSLALSRLLDEYLKTLYWRLHLKFFEGLLPGAMLIARPPDLLALVAANPRPSVVLYPDPPLGDAECELLRKLIPDLRLETPTSLYLAS
ncbi:MAG: hypothetical protein QOF89_5377 [Acidobacteriota bacterium]|jgi:hypothetical protein|nr:hypothetical protein [Acidobacteriota bacterium]